MRTALIRAVLVDDEMLARLALRQALQSHMDVTVVGECCNAADAVQAIEAASPDLIFLDIHMPGMDGFDLLREVRPGSLPMVVFATAYDQHALRAFDANALDYVLKPIDQDRFDRTMTRVRSRWHGLLATRDAAEVPSCDLPAYAEGREWLARMSVKVGEHIRVLATREIDWIEANGNYVHVHVGGATYLHRQTLRQLQDTLDPMRFLRVHRAVLVNVDRVSEVHPLFNGNAELVLRDGTHLGLSRRFRSHARQLLGLP